jgi:hypothetical protein
MAEYIERRALIAAYDATHKGAAGRARKLMVDAPAADVEPVRHGRWIDVRGEASGMNWKCSKCCKRVMPKYPYCPNCGATMDLEVSE